ncbi:OmpH family outer membrane protein [Mariprofundus sp. EBB-1]|uniref:OmpH family outer membrane protein n=1 Tax=Mariprofundus sp. EBB-1 TaxID=2650971 RepID=UPI000EF2396B|nr:OmpH family outer membrane protein [Mariprofundus sp. EBB-1]RLL52892.1 OmpH family outer membrane protein [Mariprofundus sp. EBB-1]
MLKKLKVPALAASIVLSCTFGAISSQAGELKVGYIDIKTALENTAEYQSGMKRLQALSDTKLKALKALKANIDSAEKDIMSQSLAMSQEHLAQKQQNLKEMGKNFQRMQQDAQEELSAEKNRMDIASMAKFQKVITTYAKKNKFDMIIPRPVFLYINPKLDVTGDITKLLDK